MNCAWVYMITNAHHSVLYVGVTNSLPRRVREHATKRNPDSFSARYNVHKLVYYEGFTTFKEAIAREKFIKGKSRRWKEAQIERMNPEWADLSS